ncbi:MAG: ATP-binding cassette domain-containing protein [Janthinobacterium lividum]
MTEPHTRLSVQGSVGPLSLHFEAEFSAPWTILFGPSGCGKSTLLRAICGLGGKLSVHCAVASQPGNIWTSLQDEGHSVPPEQRQLSYAPQQAGLFPHLTVGENIAFAQKLRRGASPRPGLTENAIALFELEPLLARRPQQLSGGERQRVSLARALAVPDARLVLLDEPFAGVDRALRDHLLAKVKAFLADRQIPAISVTHDVDEAFLLGAEVIRLHAGRNTAQGPASRVLAAEAARTVELLTPQRNLNP